MSENPRGIFAGRRVVVTGMAGAGKSTFSRALSAKTGLPLIVLDAHYWLPGWTKPTDAQWREKQRTLLADDDWIADGNYHATLDLRLARADTVVFLDTRWWICAWRVLVRGVRTRPPTTTWRPDQRQDGSCRRSSHWSKHHMSPPGRGSKVPTPACSEMLHRPEAHPHATPRHTVGDRPQLSQYGRSTGRAPGRALVVDRHDEHAGRGGRDLLVVGGRGQSLL